MIEEAAGTRLYESKKEAAQRTIEKKDAKLKEIDSVCVCVLYSKTALTLIVISILQLVIGLPVSGSVKYWKSCAERFP